MNLNYLFQTNDQLTYKEIESLFLLQSQILEKAVLSKNGTESLVLLCQLTEKLLPSSVGSIMLLDESKNVLNVLCAPSVTTEAISLLNGLKPGPEAGSCGNTAYHRKAQFVCDTSNDPRWGDLRKFALRFNILSCWSVPIYEKDGKILGTFALSSMVKRLPTPFHQTLLEVAAYLASLILQRQKLDRILTYSARYDSLTDLPNRTYLSSYVQNQIVEAESEKSQLAIIFIDLDRFKYINDTYGHSLGDQVLIKIAYRLKQLKSEELFISRLGGDEFILIKPFRDSLVSVIEIIESVMLLISHPLAIEDKTFYIMSSIGISLYPNHGKDEKTLLSKADAAMYEAKKRGKNQYCFYLSHIQEKLIHSLSVEQELRKAIQNEEFELYYQPKFKTKGISLSGAEALIRWKHPKKGLILPGYFIDIAEETDLIIPLGEWILEKGCEQLKKWQDTGYQKLSLSINLSNCQLKNKVIKKLLKIIEKTNVNTRFLELEITETYAMENIDKVKDLLQIVHEKNIKIALDDFGVGYSSLAILKDLPLNKLKIDKSLIHQIVKNSKEQAICQAIINLSKALELKVTAEGIESIEQVELMKKLNCYELQGFYFSYPLEVSNFEKLYLSM